MEHFLKLGDLNLHNPDLKFGVLHTGNTLIIFIKCSLI